MNRQEYYRPGFIWRLCQALYLQFFIGALVACVFLSAHLRLIPEPQKLAVLLEGVFDKHGLPVIIICAFFENIGGFNIYFPGSIVILTGMALTAGKPALAFLTFVCISVSSVIAHIANYFGAKVLHKKRVLDTDSRGFPSFWEFLVSFWHPHFAAVVCLKSGSVGMPFTKFLRSMLPSALAWYMLWAILMYFVGYAAKSSRGLIALFLLYLVVWTCYDAYKFYVQENSLS